jgi:membrane-associated protease RseP (regulator of RpoE activity)
MRALDPDHSLESYPVPSAAPPWGPAVAARPPRRAPIINLVLFALTCVTTTMAGAFTAGADPLSDWGSMRAGIPFAATLMSILLFHELGHYTLAKLHGVQATLPYFIPGPPFFVGTFGAFIRMKSPPTTRRALFDVGAAGPWAGLLVAIPAVLVGLRLSEVHPLGVSGGGLILGDSILFSFLTQLALGTTPSSATIILHPIALAGWFGLFVTALNLLPVGQLDGGHVIYALFGRAHRWIARLFLLVIAFLGVQGWDGWFMWIILLLIIGVDHPPTVDAVTPLSGRRRFAAWLSVGAFIVTFIPQPFSTAEPSPIFEGERTPAVWQPDQQRHTRDGLLLPLHFTPPRVRGVPL